jgi:hypothetical protein
MPVAWAKEQLHFALVPRRIAATGSEADIDEIRPEAVDQLLKLVGLKP